MDNLWYSPPPNVLKINVHGVIEEFPVANGNMNATVLVAINHDGVIQWDLMGPLKGMEGFESQVWAIHMVMKIAYKQQVQHVHIETDNHLHLTC